MKNVAREVTNGVIYKNNRATHAVANIKRVYDDRLVKHDFL